MLNTKESTSVKFTHKFRPIKCKNWNSFKNVVAQLPRCLPCLSLSGLTLTPIPPAPKPWSLSQIVPWSFKTCQIIIQSLIGLSTLLQSSSICINSSLFFHSKFPNFQKNSNLCKTNLSPNSPADSRACCVRKNYFALKISVSAEEIYFGKPFFCFFFSERFAVWMRWKL